MAKRFQVLAATVFLSLSVCVVAWADAVKTAPAAPAAPAKAEADAPDAVVLRAISAGITNNFDAYLAELLPDRKDSPEQKSQLQRYEWKRFAGQAAWYVADTAKPAITIAKRQPASDTKIKLFIKDLKNKDAMPRPIELTRKDGRWYISANSL